ncbi:putative RNA polymerase ECF-subfamily sigma factor [Serinicoccus hydrothermalis]|uniref:Putative RNA polymerase ECF-subfamily sigma factor n=1 Tax=Serinicoccus hydrothermalis TaxID=1758689 RepID=A0A1B1NFN2_9MICO|nr:sigma-70 family RNA polymerase sigma factor [Serinicoccus hydrothermalis]ANS80233.1 putative RNA polymerase ECF-subfamily sigma factor [Serinicoccus hydrothermalis]
MPLRLAGDQPGTGTTGTPRDATWFDSFFAQHATQVHRYLTRRAARDDVEDLTAEVFATAWRRREKIPADYELPWLYRTASYVLANHRRKPTLTLLSDYSGQEEGDLHVRSVDPADLVMADDEVRRAMSRLSTRDRSILMLHAWEGLDGEGLAQALGLTRGGAAAALSRARARLREAWEHDH